MRYVTYDQVGNLTGCYLQEMPPEHKDCFIEISEEQATSWANLRANPARDGLEAIPPSTEVDKEKFNAPILAALEVIDAKSIRPLREGDSARVAAYEAQAASLRAQLMK